MEQAKKLKELAGGMSVLYVEDERDIREETAEFLKKFFLTVDVAKNGQEGIDLFKRHRHDVIITDVIMPVMEGLEMIELIRAIDAVVPILVFSAYDYSNLLEPQMPNGANAMLQKPTTYDGLINSLYTVIEQIKSKDNSLDELKKAMKVLEARVTELEDKIIRK
jgi:YesN/AraC family two-component response regulator